MLPAGPLTVWIAAVAATAIAAVVLAMTPTRRSVVRVRAAGVNPADVMLRDGSLAEWYRDLETRVRFREFDRVQRLRAAIGVDANCFHR